MPYNPKLPLILCILLFSSAIGQEIKSITIRIQPSIERADNLALQGHQHASEGKLAEALENYTEATNILPDSNVTSQRRWVYKKKFYECLLMYCEAEFKPNNPEGWLDAIRTVGTPLLIEWKSWNSSESAKTSLAALSQIVLKPLLLLGLFSCLFGMLMRKQRRNWKTGFVIISSITVLFIAFAICAHYGNFFWVIKADNQNVAIGAGIGGSIIFLVLLLPYIFGNFLIRRWLIPIPEGHNK